MTNWYTSDLHFDHKNIMIYEKRPFRPNVEDENVTDEDVTAMNEGMIKNWNDKVKAEDTVYVVGDMALGNRSKLPEIMARLNGTKYLIMGNHEKNRSSMLKAGFKDVYSSLCVSDSGKIIYMRHIPNMAFWKGLKEGESVPDLHFCGHVHSAWSHKEVDGHHIYNVGVDVSDFKPLTLQEVLDRQDKSTGKVHREDEAENEGLVKFIERNMWK